MEAQLRRERECNLVATSENQVLLSDRSAIDPLVYAILTAKDEKEASEKRNALVNSVEFQRAIPMYQSSVFVLLNPVPDWLVDDGVRSMDNQVECSLVFRKALSELGISYSEIGPETRDLHERVAIVLGLLED